MSILLVVLGFGPKPQRFTRSNRMRIFVSVLMLCLCLTGTALSSPTLTGESGLYRLPTGSTLYKGGWYLGISANTWTSDLRAGGEPLFLSGYEGRVFGTYAPTSWFEFGGSVPYRTATMNIVPRLGRAYRWNDRLDGDSFSGLGDPQLFGRFKVMSLSQPRLDLSIGVHTKLGLAESVHTPLGTGESDYGVSASITHHWCRVSLTGHVRYDLIGEPTDRYDVDVKMNNRFTFGLGLTACLTDRLQLITELSGHNAIYDYDPFWGEQEDSLTGFVGLRLVPKGNFSLTAGVDYDFASEEPRVNGGITIAWGKKSRTDECLHCDESEPQGAANTPPTVALFASPTLLTMQPGDPCPDYNLSWTANDREDHYGSLDLNLTVNGTKMPLDTNLSLMVITGCEGTYVYCITVTDSGGLSARDCTTVTVLSGDQQPSAKEEPATTKVLGIVYFDFDRWNIEQQYNSLLDEYAAILRDNPDMKVSLIGYTDPYGSEEYNLDLGWKRVRAVGQALETRGVTKGQFGKASAGEHGIVLPSAEDGTDKQAQRINRRVEVYIIDLPAGGVQIKFQNPASAKTK